MKLNIVCSKTKKIFYTISDNPLILGRGTEIQCLDKRVSRKHVEVIKEGEDSLAVSALHTNPCYFMKKGEPPVVILSKGEKTTLSTGDFFALIPDSTWFEVVAEDATEVIRSEISRDERETTPDDILPVPDSSTFSVAENARIHSNSPELASDYQDETEKNIPSPSFLPSEELHAEQSSTSDDLEKQATSVCNSTTICDSSPSIECSSGNLQQVPLNNAVESEDLDTEDLLGIFNEVDNQDNSKRRLLAAHVHETYDSPPDAKKPKMHDLNPVPSTSNSSTAQLSSECLNEEQPSMVHVKHEEQKDSEGGSLSQEEKVEGIIFGELPASKSPPKRPICQYEGACYRRNAQHKLDFAHPGDADWTPKDQRPMCQYGLSCYRRSKAHKAQFRHPVRGTRRMLNPNPTPPSSGEESFDEEEDFSDDLDEDFHYSSGE